MISVFYVPDPTNWQKASILSLPQGLAITLGGILLSVFGSKIRRWHWQQTICVFLSVVFGTLLALGNKNNQTLMIVFVTLSLVPFGWALYLCIAVTQVSLLLCTAKLSNTNI
jgi:hypothetical protein